MEFHSYDLENESEKLAAMFRPAGARYGYQGTNSASNDVYRKAIELLSEAFGPAIVFDDWREVVNVEEWPEELKHKPTKDTWYFNVNGTFSELYLTSELQVSYLALALGNVTINNWRGEARSELAR